MNERKRADLIKEAFELGFQYEKNYHGCAQCTLAACFEMNGKIEPLLFQAASGLSGGIGLNSDGSCGGYSGGVLYLSSRIGRRLERIPIDGDKEASKKSQEMAQRLHDKFIEKYGSVICSDIHQNIFGKVFYLRDASTREAFEEAGAHTDKCTTVVGNACSWVTEILIEEGLF